MGTNATGRKHNRWPEELKREIVAASLAPGASVSVVARQYDVNANQIFSWRKRYREEAHQPSNQTAPDPDPDAPSFLGLSRCSPTGIMVASAPLACCRFHGH